ncbi:MAG: hypothetical protein JKY50_10055 [Oleispira sp.]|nr:hypothetical protein [Oleispira sp.]MBL4882453.1 hypothetical protein [Oleispira sp.]
MPALNSVFRKALLTVFSASLLFGCSAFDNDDDDDDPVVTTSFSGKVADGYLAGAKVCLDLNSNKVCDEGEPSTTSTDGGVFDFDSITQAQLDSAPLLVEIIVGETVDEDNPNVAITKKYTLTAPAGYAFISPLTTMVQSEIENSGLSPEDAEGSVQAKLGTTLDLSADYVAGAEGEIDADEFARLHKIAQVTVVVLQNNIELVENILAGTDVSFEDLVGLIVSQVLDALETISTQVAAAGDNFDPTTVAESDAVDAANVDPATVEEDIAEREAARLIATANIAAVLASGDSLHFFEADSYNSTLEFFYSSVSPGANNTVVISDFIYNTTSDTWVADTDSEDDNNQACVLVNSSWNCVADEDETISFEGDAVIVKIGGLEATRSEITGVSADLVGKRIQTFLSDDEFLLVTDPKANFTAGSTGYKLSFTQAQAMYVIFKHNVDATTDCWQDGGESQAIEVGLPFNPTDEWCNNAFIRTGDGDHSNDGAAATSLAQLISTTAATNPTDISDIKGTSIFGGHVEIMAEFVSGGVANYYGIRHQQGQPSVIESKLVGSWTEDIVDGKTLLSFMLPPVFAQQGDFDSDEFSQFFTVDDGFVRRGGVQPAGTRENDEWVFNDTARDQILSAFDYALLVDLIPCTTGDVDHQLDNLAEAPGGTAAEFVSAASGCSAVTFAANELVGTTLVAEFGFLNFKTASSGVFLGEVGDDMNAVLDFTWAVDGNGHIVVNTSTIEGGVTVHLRLTLAKITDNTRQISLKTFGQEASSAAGLDTAKGNIEGEIWGKN